MGLKKKGKKKKISSKVKKKTENDGENKSIMEAFEYKDPDLYTPRAKLEIKLASPYTPKLSKFKLILSKFIQFLCLYSFRRRVHDHGKSC